MSPLSVALPSPSFEAIYQAIYPGPQGSPSRRPGVGIGSGLLDGDWAIVPPTGLGAATTPDIGLTRSVMTWATVGGSTGSEYDVRNGRNVVRWEGISGPTTAGPTQCIAIPGWMPAYDASELAPGSTVNPESAVAVFDFFLSLGSPGGLPPADSSPIFFVPKQRGVDGRSVPGFAIPNRDAGGFGIFLNAGPAYEYVAWDETFAILDRVPLPVASVTDTNWFRIQIVTALPGIDATLQVSVNGEVAASRTFGSAQLQTPTQASAALPDPASPIYSMGVSWRDSASAPMYADMAVTLSRFTPDGRQIVGV